MVVVPSGAAQAGASRPKLPARMRLHDQVDTSPFHFANSISYGTLHGSEPDVQLNTFFIQDRC